MDRPQAFPVLTLCYPYYDNPGMLREHYYQWAALPDLIKEQIEVVIFDDASPTVPAIDVLRLSDLPPLRIYRIHKNIRWGWHQARNGCAKKAQGRWLLMTDMDHGAEADTLGRILRDPPDPAALWTFRRFDLTEDGARSGLRPVKVHFNSFLLTRDLFGRIGGYDEALGEVYSGKDGEFRKRAAKLAPIRVLPEPMRLIRYQRDLVADASTVGMERKSKADSAKAQALIRKLEADPKRAIQFMTFKYSRQL